MKIFIFAVVLILTAGVVMAEPTWEDIAQQIESLPDGATYKLPVGKYYAARTIRIGGNGKEITGNIIWDAGYGIPTWAIADKYTIIVLQENVSAFELAPGASNTTIKLRL